MFGHSLLYLILAAIAGLTMALQGSLNSVLGKKIGIFEASFIVHFLAAIIIIIILLLNINRGDISKWREAPWYLYLGGVLAVVITYTVIVSIPNLGVAVATTLIVATQVSTACIIDHFGAFGLERIPFSWYKLFGLLLLVAGVRLMLIQ
ncbi:DMT family transporter [Natronospora cellulosivora (SeqCode)]